MMCFSSPTSKVHPENPQSVPIIDYIVGK